jgi:hypothetical protein
MCLQSVRRINDIELGIPRKPSICRLKSANGVMQFTRDAKNGRATPVHRIVFAHTERGKCKSTVIFPYVIPEAYRSCIP